MKPKETLVLSSDEEEEDSDMEENFVLLTEGKRRGEDRPEEEEQSDDDDDGAEDEEESDDEEETGDEDAEDVEESGDEQVESDDEGEDEEDDDQDDVDSESDEEKEEEQERDEGVRNLQTREDVKRELSTMSFEDLIALQNKVGTKAFQQVVHGDDKADAEKQQQKKKNKRLNKNRPMEISSKRPVSFIRQIVPAKKSTSRDPRFDDLSGEYKADIFRKTYKFIDDIRSKEMKLIQKKLKKAKSTQRKEKLDFLLKRMKNQERARENEAQRRERELQFKRQQRERANQGARPFFLKESDKKKLQLAERYQELKKSGGLDKFLNKKRKRNAGRDRRKLPQQQRAAGKT